MTDGGDRIGAPPEHAGSVTFGPEKIMVVDDEPGVRRYLMRSVAGQGFLADEYESSDLALPALRGGEYGAALVDIRMPGHDGLWLLSRVVEEGLDVSVVMVTANSDVRTAVGCLTRGAANYIAKPVDPDELVQVVRKALEDRRLRLENRAYRQDLERLVRERTVQLEQALREVSGANVVLERAYRESIYRLAAAAEYRDEETGNHIRRIGLYSHMIAEGLECDPEFLDLILLASPMHDIGKIGIRDSILLKPGPLTSEEFEEMKAHTVIGARILENSESPLMRIAETIALTHHERFDGSGYPYGLAGGDIPLAGRIVAVADVFDALTSRRVYKPAFPVDTALQIIREESPGHFDLFVLAGFEARLDNILIVRQEFEDDAERMEQPRYGRLEPEVLDALKFLEGKAGIGGVGVGDERPAP
ncbi:MAG: HD domain-containing phosphohydrolase [Thermoleophilia bacterium]